MREGAALVLDRVTKNFGGLSALSDVSFQVEPGAIHGVIGPNGAGKTTLFNVITGVFPPDAGRIGFAGETLGRSRPHERTRLGICRTYQNIKLFKSATVLENVQVALPFGWGAQCLQLVGSLPFRTGRAERRLRARAGELLEFVGLYEKRGHVASSLPFGDQRRLEIARALATAPKLLLLDEPCAGMNQAEKQPMVRLIREIRDRGVTVLVIEHDMNVLREVCGVLTVLNFGVVIAHGTPATIQRDPVVIEAYLGREEG